MIETFDKFESSHVAGAHYNADTKEMHVSFKDGSRYRYDKVVPQVWQNMKDSKSVGTYLRQHVIPKHAAVKILPL